MSSDKAPACGKQPCDHWEASSPSQPFLGHCAQASCPNYLESCPAHNTQDWFSRSKQLRTVLRS